MTQDVSEKTRLADELNALSLQVNDLKTTQEELFAWVQELRSTPKAFEIVAERPELVPTYAKPDDSGMDLRADIRDPIDLEAGCQVLVPTGIKIALKPGYEAQIRPRSGLAAKHAISVTNAPGTIDAGFRSTIQVILINHGHCTFTINPGDRIAQMVVARVERVQWQVVESLDQTERGEGGFGSSGVK